MKDKKNYSKYLVIFVDILGSKNRRDFDEVYHINEIFHGEMEKNQNNDMDYRVYYRKIYSFSDCAYIFYGYKDDVEDSRKVEGKLFTVAMCNCEPIFIRLIKERILFRGGVTYGDAYIDKDRSMFFGEAVNSAYIMESGEAVHPRIIVDDYVADAIINNIDNVKYKLVTQNPEFVKCLGMNLMPRIPETGDGIIEKDYDGKYIFNYLHFPENNMAFQPYCLSGENFLEGIIEYCNEQISSGKFDYRVLDKYFYLKRFAYEKLCNLTIPTN